MSVKTMRLWALAPGPVKIELTPVFVPPTAMCGGDAGSGPRHGYPGRRSVARSDAAICKFIAEDGRAAQKPLFGLESGPPANH